ncbi:restriction endonuclease [Planctomicrobium sp. SH661]|uniref:restriction endonuclease n=1 Tax=Planctomicrobium sp. SH661 TaxID=3448124 RepID=UPI003F5BCCC1
MQHRWRKRPFKPDDRDPNVLWMEFGDGYVIPHEGRYLAVSSGISVLRDADILMQTELIRLGTSVPRGQVITGTTRAWDVLRQELLKHSELFDYFPRWHRKFEEFVGGAYHESQWSNVILSPRSGDGGFDIAAFKGGQQILDEIKAYRSGRLVTHQIVRAILGLLVLHDDLNQVRVTTSSGFSPNVIADFAKVIPDKLQLTDRGQLIGWLNQMGTAEAESSGLPLATVNSRPWKVFF